MIPQKEEESHTQEKVQASPKQGSKLPSQKEEKCGWGSDCPFCKAQKKDGEDHQQKPLPKWQAKRPDTLSMTKTRQMERLNTKYNLDCFSDSELDSESDEDEQYQYEHGYETLI